MKATLTPSEQELVNATVEVFLRYYSDIYFEQPMNKLYLKAIQGNIDEWMKERKLDSAVFTSAIIQTLCLTLIHALEGEDEE
jgi:hypothetical protein